MRADAWERRAAGGGAGGAQTQFLLAEVGQGMYAVLLPLVGSTFRSALWGTVRTPLRHRPCLPQWQPPRPRAADRGRTG